ncbi:MAG: hypothetical protein E6J45_00270, partial [Chloroflexi bacterium]
MTSAKATYTGGVQDTGLFELDRDTLPSTCPPNDFAGLYTVGGTNPCGSDGFAFVPDGVASADTTYWAGGGSKDAYDPALGPWMWSSADVAPSKDDIDNAFAAKYTLTSGTDKTPFIFFGADRFATSGDAQMGFDFLQAHACLAGQVTGGQGVCPSTTPNQTANSGKFVDPDTGVPVHHTNHDLLVLVNFNNGGTLGLAGVFEWGGDTTPPTGVGAFTQVLFTTSTTSADCATISDPNDFCATSTISGQDHTGDPVWPYTRKGVTGQATYVASSLIKGGLNLNRIPGAAGACFPSFVAETRSSAGPSTGLSLQAQLKDLAFGAFQPCTSTTVTAPQLDTTGTNPVPASGVSVGTGNTGVDVFDQAVVTVSGPSSFGGTVTFSLCGPTATTSTALCGTGGSQIGAAKAITPSATTVYSDAAHLTEAGRYCFRAVYSGDSSAGVPGSHDSSAGECFLVNPVTPTLGTQAVDANGIAITAPVNLGSEIYDTAALGGTSYEPGSGALGSDGSVGDPSHTVTRNTKAGGTITFTLTGPDTVGSTTNCNTAATGFTPILVDIANGGDGTYGGPTGSPVVGFTPAAPGVYHWKAAYSGDLPNTNSQTHNGDCSDSHENVTVKVPTTTTTRQFVYPQDKAKIAAS